MLPDRLPMPPLWQTEKAIKGAWRCGLERPEGNSCFNWYVVGSRSGEKKAAIIVFYCRMKLAEADGYVAPVEHGVKLRILADWEGLMAVGVFVFADAMLWHELNRHDDHYPVADMERLKWN